MRAGEHVLYESLVARDVYETDANSVEVEFRESQVNGDSATLLFG